VGSAVAAQPAARSRRSIPSRRAPVIAINYDYLRKDITYLALLAPAMVVLVVIAYFTLH
jgi:hypothetical protein